MFIAVVVCLVKTRMSQSALIVQDVMLVGVAVHVFALLRHKCDQRMLILRRLLFNSVYLDMRH